jgi:hypothetical protein
MADLVGDPIFIVLLAFSSITAIIVVAASMRMGRPPRAALYPPTP